MAGGVGILQLDWNMSGDYIQTVNMVIKPLLNSFAKYFQNPISGLQPQLLEREHVQAGEVRRRVP